MKNAVVGFSTNHNYDSLNIFIRSAREIYDENECDIIIFTNSYEKWYSEFDGLSVQFLPTINLYDGKRRIFVTLMLKTFLLLAKFVNNFSSIRPIYSRFWENMCETFLHPHIIRWVSYERFLDISRNYRFILLSDVRDVVFQDEFFGSVTSSNKVFFADQSINYGDGGCDSDWFRAAWGDKALKDAAGKPCLCIGTILGSHEAILDFTRQIKKCLLADPYRGVEQAIFNYLLMHRIISTEYEVLPNVDGPIATLANKAAVSNKVIVKEKIFRKQDMSVIPIVHMYDRDHDANRLISKKYSEL